MPLAEVKSIRESAPLTDVPGMLRALADLIEKGEGDFADVTEAVVIRDGGDSLAPAIHAYGRCTPESSFVLIARGHGELLRMLNNGLITRTAKE